MRGLIAFTKKEIMELARTGRLTILLILFVLFGIMNPAIAKLTPWMFEMMGDSLAEQGIVIKEITVDALTSWTQFYKNISMELIVVVVMFSGSLTSEYQKGTLINMLTKGLARWKVLLAKSLVIIGCWTLCYWCCFFITYGYNAYFWDNSIASHVFYGAFCIYVFGLWLISLILLASSFLQANFAVLLMTGGAVAVSYILSMIPSITEKLPSYLMQAGAMLNKTLAAGDFRESMIFTFLLIVINFLIAVVCFNHRNIA